MIIPTPSTEEAAGRALARELHSAHYYTPEGEPRYTREDGKPVTLREARKGGWFPSITHIFNVLENRALRMYLDKQLLTASFNVRPKDEEATDDYFSRVLTRRKLDANQAADVGTATHSGIEAILKNERWDKENPLLRVIADWVQDNVEVLHWQEETLVNEILGLAGRCDAFVNLKGIGHAVIDWKTRRFKEQKSGYKCGWYKKDVRQISFYAEAVERGLEAVGLHFEVTAINVAINTKGEAVVEAKEWSTDERTASLKIVESINMIWQDENNYAPTGTQHYYLGNKMPQ